MPSEPTSTPPPPGALVSTRKKSRDTPARADRDWLAGKTADIVGWAYRQACDAVRIGQAIEEVRGRLKKGDYKRWVARELPFSQTTAKRYRYVAAAFGRFASVQFGLFDESALYVLAELSVPQPVREHAVQLAAEGQRITHAVALEIIDSHRPVRDDAEPAPVASFAAKLAERKCLGLECAAVFRGATPGFCEKCKKKQAQPDPVRELTEEQLRKRWRIIEELAERSTEVRISKVEDTDDEEPLFDVRCYFPDAGPKHTVRRDLYDALAVCAGREETRHCGKCRSDLPVGQFGKNRLNPGGLMYRCKPCEKARRRAMRVEARTAREAARAAAPSGAPASAPTSPTQPP